MSLIENIIRPEIRALASYHVPDAEGFIKLDAMENPYLLPEEMRAELGRHLSQVALNRYPVPSYKTLKGKIKQKLGVPDDFDLILGNGSDELISMISIACARPGAKVLAPTPGFVMYSMSAKLSGMQYVGVPLTSDFSLDMPAMLAAIAEQRPAITYLAYPNNPTGNLYDRADMLALIEAVGDTGVVVVDEAYQPFAQTSFMSRLPEFPNVIAMRTVSKLGLAGIRLGYMSASDALLAEFEKVRPPYNVNVLSQAAAEFVLDRVEVLDRQAALLCDERTMLAQELAALPGVEVFPSAANFLLVRLHAPNPDTDAVNTGLLERRVLVKNVGKMHPLLHDCLRVTVSTPEENQIFLDAFKASLAPPTK